MPNQIMAVKTFLKDQLPRDTENRVACVNLMLVLLVSDGPMRIHDILENLAAYSDEIKLVEPMGVDECKNLLNQLVKLKLVGSLAKTFFGLAPALRKECAKVSNAAGFDDECLPDWRE